MPKSHSTFPFNAFGSDSGAGGSASNSILQALYARSTTDTVLLSGVPQTILSQAITVSEGGRLVISASVDGSVETALELQTLLEYNVFIDGVLQTGGFMAVPGEASALFISGALAAGIHVISIEATASGGNVSIAPTTTDDREHAQLIIVELAV